MKTKIILSLLLVIILALSITACNNNDTPQGQPEEGAATADSGGAQDIGSGDTVFIFEVTDDEGNVSSWNVHTNQATVGGALVEAGLVSGDESAFGLMVTHVDGLRADFEEDGAFWAFYIDGEMAMEGVDATYIEDGVVYAFVYTPA